MGNSQKNQYYQNDWYPKYMFLVDNLSNKSDNFTHDLIFKIQETDFPTSFSQK